MLTAVQDGAQAVHHTATSAWQRAAFHYALLHKGKHIKWVTGMLRPDAEQWIVWHCPWPVSASVMSIPEEATGSLVPCSLNPSSTDWLDPVMHCICAMQDSLAYTIPQKHRQLCTPVRYIVSHTVPSCMPLAEP